MKKGQRPVCDPDLLESLGPRAGTLQGAHFAASHMWKMFKESCTDSQGPQKNQTMDHHDGPRINYLIELTA